MKTGNFIDAKIGDNERALASNLSTHSFRSVCDSARYTALAAFQEYWNELSLDCCKGPERGLRASIVPQRRAFNPMKIHRHLPDIFIADWQAEDRLMVRLSGTAIDDSAGFSMKGRNFLDVCLPCERAFYAEVTKATVQQPCGVQLTRIITLKFGQRYQYNALFFPLADRNGVPRYIVGMAKLSVEDMYDEMNHSNQMFSEISEFSYIDIGNGVPPMPALMPGPKLD